jgi:hypothetical protein
VCGGKSGQFRLEQLDIGLRVAHQPGLRILSRPFAAGFPNMIYVALDGIVDRQDYRASALSKVVKPRSGRSARGIVTLMMRKLCEIA